MSSSSSLKSITLARIMLRDDHRMVGIEEAYVEGGVGDQCNLALTMVAIPTAVGMAVLRYRLYDIERVISATVAYSVIATVLAAISWP